VQSSGEPVPDPGGPALSTGLSRPSILRVYGGWQIAALALAGLAIAVAGALLPATWAAGTSTATALRAE